MPNTYPYLNFRTILKALAIASILLVYSLESNSQTFAAAGIYRTINFQGKVVSKTTGTNISNGAYDFSFKLYDAASSGTLLWTENWSGGNQITVTDGIFRATLGSITTFASAGVDFNTDNLFLDVTFNGEAFGTRVRFTAVPYAINAEKVSGLSVTNTTGTFTLTNGKTFSISNTLSFAGTDSTSFTFPSTSGGLVITSNAPSQTITSTQTSGTILGLTDSTGLTGSIKGLDIALTSSTNSQNKTGIAFDLSNGSSGIYYDVLGTGSAWSVTRAGEATFVSVNSGSGAISGGAGSFTALTSSGATTLGTGSSLTNTFGSGASSVNTIGSTTTPGALTLHGATTLDNTFTVSGSNLTTLGGNLTVTGTTWTATPTISGKITASGGIDVAANQNLTLSSGTGVYSQTFTGTTTDAATITAGSLTTGSALVLTGPSGGTAGATDATLKISGDIGDINTANGLVSLAATFDTTAASADGINLYLNTTNSNGTNANSAYGIYNNFSDAIALANTNYGMYTRVNNTGALNAAATKTVYGNYIEAIGTGATTNASVVTNLYGEYITTNASHASNNGTVNQYGLYIANGTSSTNGTSTKYGLYVESPTGADANYAGVFAGGNVGIGDTTPTAELDLTGTFQIKRPTNGGVDWQIFQVFDDTGTATNNACSDGTLDYDAGSGNDITFLCLSNTGTPVAAFQGNGDLELAGTLAQSTTPDISENIRIDESSIEAGDLVISQTYDSSAANPYEHAIASKTETAYDSRVIGVISTDPGILLNARVLSNEVNPYQGMEKPLVIAGRVPTKVSSVNGTINAGDLITTSSISGVGMKATKPGSVVGVALEEYNNPDPNSVGKILVLVNTSWYDPDVYITNSGNLSLEENIPGNFVVKYQNGSKSSRIGVFAETVIARIRSGIIVAKSVTTDSLAIATENITIAGQNIKDYIAQIVDERIQKGHTSSSAEVDPTGLEVRNASSSAVLSLDDKIALINSIFEERYASLAAETSTNSGILSGNVLAIESSTLSIDGIVVGSATISGSLKVKTNTFIEGILTVVDTIKANNFIASGLSTFFGEVIFKDITVFEGDVVFSKNMGGLTTIEKGKKNTSIMFEKELEEDPIVNISNYTNKLSESEFKNKVAEGECVSDEGIERCEEEISEEALLNSEYIISKKSKKGFTILLKNEATTDLNFSWTLVNIRKEASSL